MRAKRLAECHKGFLKIRFPDNQVSPSRVKQLDELAIRQGYLPEMVAQFRYSGGVKGEAVLAAARMDTPRRKFKVYTTEQRVAANVTAFQRIAFPKTMAA